MKRNSRDLISNLFKKSALILIPARTSDSVQKKDEGWKLILSILCIPFFSSSF